MKKIIVLLLLITICSKIFASHIVGGEVFYTYIGVGTNPSESKYRISVRLFTDCNVPCGGSSNVACLTNTCLIGIFTNISPYTKISNYNLPIEKKEKISLSTYPDCISQQLPVCYEVNTYSSIITLSDNNDGYFISYQNCCRADSKNVLGDPSTISGIPGAAYTAIIPGKKVLPTGKNSSAVFKLKDTSLVCYESQFLLDFSAEDNDGDSLSYAFTSAYDGGSLPAYDNVQGPDTPPYGRVSYQTGSGFSGFQPLGDLVTLNPVTGLISGISPSVIGRYVVNVVVYEWRGGVRIAEHQKDFIMRVENCNVPSATLDPTYITCDGFDLSFKNNSTSPIINSYYWDFGVEGSDADTSVSPTPTFVYTTAGTYTVTLITNRGQQCSDTATTTAKVYPGFIPDFQIDGSCLINPYSFTDKTTSVYGAVDSWRWDFGDLNTIADTSIQKNATYLYNATQSIDVRLIVTNSEGCVDTVTKQLQVSDKPVVELAFRDTLICVKDTLQLNANSGGDVVYKWSASPTISDINIPKPHVYPKDTTVYTLTIDNKGCVATDSVTVNVIPFVTLSLAPDTTICLTDQVQMFPNTNALYFSWSPTEGASDVTVRNPLMQPLTKTTYTLFASVGKCNATDNITISVVPYPQVSAGNDTSICYGTTALLHATTTAPNYNWSPVTALIRSNTLSPEASPVRSTPYTITVTDNLGCPKPVSDTVLVTVIPPVPAFAGHDTTIVINQPLQLNATGGAIYAWSPSTGMNDPNIANPVVILGPQYDSIIYRVLVSTPEGCSATDEMQVIVFKTAPDIIVPSAFTPNGDGSNDLMRPKVVGMKQFTYFRIYNRLGQLLYSTSTEGQGWDGRLSGILQPSGAYVYMAQGIDYTGKTINRKGTLVLIR